MTVDGGPGDGLTIEIRNRLPVGALHAADIPGAGTGIVGLTERASLAGGRLEHGRTEAGRLPAVGVVAVGGVSASRSAS